MEVGESIIVICRAGYRLNGDIINRCLRNGSWSLQVPRCSPINCLPLNNISHGYVVGGSTEYQSVVQYQCDPGFTLQGKRILWLWHNKRVIMYANTNRSKFYLV